MKSKCVEIPEMLYEIAAEFSAAATAAVRSSPRLENSCFKSDSNSTKFSRSTLGSPSLCPGYSQSTSSPSNPIRLQNFAASFANRNLNAGLWATVENFSEPSFQPPIATRVFSFGFTSFKSLNFRIVPKPQLSSKSSQGSSIEMVPFVENIDPALCTHLIYSFFGLNADGTVAILDAWLDLPDNYGLNAIGRLNKLKTLNPSLKTLAAIGGWNWGSAKFSTVAKSATLRRKFASEARAFCQKYGFDGIDIDWEYPAQRDGDASVDKANFVLMLKDLNTELKKYGLLLTVAVGAAEGSASISYDIPQISNNVDFINLMEYDFHMASDEITGNNAPLYAGSADVTTTQKQLNVLSSVQYWLSKGAPASKLNLGMPLYGRTFTLASASNNGVGAPVTGAGVPGPYTQEPGYVGYNEICERKLTGTWTEVFDNVQMVPYTYSGNQWVGFDNVKSITEKCNFIKTNGLAGGMFWSIETDDFLGKCGPKFGLISTLKSCLGTSTGSGSSGTTTTSTTTTTKPVTIPPSTTTKATSSGGFTCTSTGYFRDPVDCSKFYYCQGTYRNDFVCPAGLYFVPAAVACDWPQNVKCP